MPEAALCAIYLEDGYNTACIPQDLTQVVEMKNINVFNLNGFIFLGTTLLWLYSDMYLTLLL